MFSIISFIIFFKFFHFCPFLLFLNFCLVEWFYFPLWTPFLLSIFFLVAILTPFCSSERRWWCCMLCRPLVYSVLAHAQQLIFTFAVYKYINNFYCLSGFCEYQYLKPYFVIKRMRYALRINFILIVLLCRAAAEKLKKKAIHNIITNIIYYIREYNIVLFTGNM